MNREGLNLLRMVIERHAGLEDAVKQGDCKSIAAAVNGSMPPDMQITAVDVYQSLRGAPNFGMPTHNSQVVRARIDSMPTLYSARLNAALKGKPGEGAIQTIVNELNLSPDPAEHVTHADVVAAMELAVEPAPEKVVSATAELVGTAR